MHTAQSLIGVLAIPALAWAISDDRRALPPAALLRIIATGLAIQTVLASLLLLVPASQSFFAAAAALVRALQEATATGVQFVFGHLAGGPPPYLVSDPGRGFVLALQALPLILIMSVLSRLLYHWRILPLLVGFIARLLSSALGVSGPLGTAAAAKVFLGMIEAPLLIRPYLAALGRGELFALMTVGLATVAGTVFALYASILEPTVPGAAGHVLAASLMNVPGALVIARLMIPWQATAKFTSPLITTEHHATSTMEAISQGTSEGLRLLAHVTAMLIVMVALVALANLALSTLGHALGLDLSLQRILALLAWPLAIVIGIPIEEAPRAASLIGIKVVLNELLAYIEMAKTPASELSQRSRTILTYALCGFANLGSVGILVGGLSSMAPERRAEISALGMRALLAGLLATMLSASIVGLLTPA